MIFNLRTNFVSPDIPTCLSLRTHMTWHEGLMETCRLPLMMITTMAYLGFPFVHTTEQWTIHAPLKRINLQIISFYVPCKTSKFAGKPCATILQLN
jgi:hypothetical protein